MNLRDGDLEARGLKNFERGTARIGMKVIVERIRPQDHFGPYAGAPADAGSGFFPEAGNSIFSGPVFGNVEAGELRHAPLRGQNATRSAGRGGSPAPG